MTRLPQPGKDAGQWGDILNDFLTQSHNTDGTLKDNVVGTSQLQDNSVGSAQLQDNAVGASQLQPGSVDETTLSSTVQTKLNQTAPVTKVNNQTGDITLTKTDIGLNNVDNTADSAKPISTATQAALDNKADLVNGKVPESQLPSFVDDVVSLNSLSDFPLNGEDGKIYIAKDTNLTYRWAGSVYTEISPSLALGETASTAYRGDWGKIAYDHTLNTNNPHSVTKAQVGLSDVDNTSDANKPVSTAQQTALNAKANASDTVNLTGDQTVAGVKTFSSSPIVPSGTSIGGVLYLTGTGFPDGVVSASVGSIYIDTAITNGASSWIKKSGTGNTGWKVLEGDTGWRRNDPANSWFLNGATPGVDGDLGTCFRREGNVVHCTLGLTTPAGWTNGTDFLAVPNGFRTPNNAKYMPGGYTGASTMAVYSAGTSMRFYSGVVSNVRFQWTWITNDPWPTTLPGIAA